MKTKTNSTKITFEGKTDSTKKQSEQNIKIEYPPNITFPINYKRDSDLYGLQTDYISNQYITIENNNIKEFAEKLGYADTTDIPDKIEISTEEINKKIEEEKEKLKEKYSEMFNKISEDDIIVTKTEKGNEYNLKISEDFLKQMQDNNETLTNEINSNETEDENNISDIISNSIKESISESIEDEEGTEKKKINLIITTENDKPIKLEFKVQEKSISIQKTEQEDTCKYMINMTTNNNESTTSITIGAEFKGISAQEKVTEMYNLSMEKVSDNETSKVEYCFENTIKFANNIQIEELAQDNCIILNGYEAEQITNFLGAVQERILEVNKEQMEELAVKESENPLTYFIDPFETQNKVLSRAEKSRGQSQIAYAKEEILLIENEVTYNYYQEVYINGETPTKSKAEMLKEAIEQGEYEGVTVTVEGTTITITLNSDTTQFAKADIDLEEGDIGYWTYSTVSE